MFIANGGNDSNDRPIMTSSRMQSEMIQRLVSCVQTTENCQYLYGLEVFDKNHFGYYSPLNFELFCQNLRMPEVS